MKPNILCIIMLHPIIKPLVVAEVEPVLLPFPLQVPVSFCDKAEVRIRFPDSTDDVIPVFGWRPLPCTTAPRAFEDLIQQQHGHVATDAITLARYTGDGFNHC